jgi:ABC-type nitrate/sulfonate/bicarbonate transport system substrate-binding protein
VATPSEPATTAALRIGGVPEHFNLPWQLAIESGEAAACGRRVIWRDYATGTGAMLADLVAEQLDLAVLLTEGAALGLARGLPVVAVSLYTTSPLIWGVHVAPGSRFHAVGELAGARFAISRPGSGSHLMSFAMALERGWPVDAIEFVAVDDLPGAIAALADGRADVFLWEHFTTQPAVDAGHFRRIGDFGAPWAAWVLCAGSDAWRRDGPAIRKLFGIVANRAARLGRDPLAPAMIANRYGLDEVAVGHWLGKTRWVASVTEPDGALAAATTMLEAAGAI